MQHGEERRLAPGHIPRLAWRWNQFGWLADGVVNQDAPRQSFGFAFVDNARPNERVMARLAPFHCLPLILLTDSTPLARLAVERHPVNNP